MIYSNDMDLKSTNMGPSMLITGGAGLIGTAAKTFFEQQGWVIRTFDQKKTDLDGRPIDFVGDILDYEAFREPFQAMDGVLHLAAISRVIDAELNKEECTRVNLKGTKRTLDFASQANCKWFIFGSSREVYGEPSSFPVSEEDGVSPINHYGHAKVSGELMVEKHCQDHQMAHSSLRFSNVYGHARDHKTRLVNAFVRNSIAGVELDIHGGNQIFDFTHIDDTVGAIFAAAEHLDKKRESLPAMHVLRGEGVTIQELAHKIIQITDSQSQISYSPGRNYDVARFYGNPARLLNTLNFSCSIDIDEGLKRVALLHQKAMAGESK